MNKEKERKINGFPEKLIRQWENEDGVNFTVALARITGWLLHIGWWSPYQNAPYELMKPIRVYLGTDSDLVFDFNGEKKN